MTVLRYLVFGLTALCLLPGVVAAQSITLTNPSASITFREGADYATQMLQNPWDMNERRDIGWEEHYNTTTIVVQNGIWGAETILGTDSPFDATAGGFFMPLFPGTKQISVADALPGDLTLPHAGIKHPIDTSKYTYLSFRLRQENRSQLIINWASDPNAVDYLPTPNTPLAVLDELIRHNADSYPFFPLNGWNIYNFDMTDLNNEFDYVQNGDWSAGIFALRIEASLNATNGDLTEIDWIRVVDPSSAPNLTITWSSAGLNANDIITVYHDINNIGFNGSPVARYVDGVNPGVYTFPSAMLPPGEHYFYLGAQQAVGGSLIGPEVRSNYSARITIDAKPLIAITSPSQTSGADYAATILGDPWDMDSLADLPNANPNIFPHAGRRFTAQTFTPSPTAEEGGTLFQATSDITPLDNGGGDDEEDPLGILLDESPKLIMSTAPFDPIDPKDYRYLTYRIRADDTDHPSIYDKAFKGFHTAPFWITSSTQRVFGEGPANIIYEGWHTYTIDLWDIPNQASEGMPYKDFHRVSQLGIELLEAQTTVDFEVDWIKLTTNNRTVDNQIDIEFTIADFDNFNFDGEIFYDTDNQDFDGTSISLLNNLSPGLNTYTWDTSALVPGTTYYIHLVISDGLNSNHVYTAVPITIGPYTPTYKKARMDYDRDGKSDQVIYRPSEGRFYQQRSASSLVYIPWVTGDQYYPVDADWDGDGITDLTLVFDWFGYNAFFIYLSATNTVDVKMWGLVTDQIVIADYNGNGIDELAVFRNGEWFIIREDGGVDVLLWGGPGDIAVPKDYDGDGSADISIWRPTDGMWWILSSATQAAVGPTAVISYQWGLPGDVPVAADWTGDGKADLAIFRPFDGNWFIKDLGTDSETVFQWGFSNDVPMIGDFNGDGIPDPTVYRPSEGTWFHKFSFGLWGGVQFGLPGDRLPVNAR